MHDIKGKPREAIRKFCELHFFWHYDLLQDELLASFPDDHRVSQRCGSVCRVIRWWMSGDVVSEGLSVHGAWGCVWVSVSHTLSGLHGHLKDERG